MIGEYINDINDPNARKIEALLSSLNRKLWLEQIGDLRNTTIIDFLYLITTYFNQCATFF
jgi:hypothetical protein